jgi:hypothetical protein
MIVPLCWWMGRQLCRDMCWMLRWVGCRSHSFQHLSWTAFGPLELVQVVCFSEALILLGFEGLHAAVLLPSLVVGSLLLSMHCNC